MVENIIEYVLMTTQYYQLWMTANMNKKEKTNVLYSRNDWHPSIVNQFDDVRDVPSFIRVNDANHSVNRMGQFHGGNNRSTMTFGRMDLIWGMHSDAGLRFPVRVEGPANVVLSNLKAWHNLGELHRRRGDAIICELACFTWNEEIDSNGLNRRGGPYRVVIENIRVKANTGNVYDVMFDNISVSWSNGMGQDRVDAIVKEHNLKMNYLRAGESVFESPTHEFVFLTEIGNL